MFDYKWIKNSIIMNIISIIVFYKYLFPKKKAVLYLDPSSSARYRKSPVTNVTLYNTQTEKMLDITEKYREKLHTITSTLPSSFIYTKNYIKELDINLNLYDTCFINKNDEELSVVEINIKEI